MLYNSALYEYTTDIDIDAFLVLKGLVCVLVTQSLISPYLFN